MSASLHFPAKIADFSPEEKLSKYLLSEPLPNMEGMDFDPKKFEKPYLQILEINNKVSNLYIESLREIVRLQDTLC